MSGVREAETPARLARRIQHLSLGREVVYHTGFLAEARLRDRDLSRLAAALTDLARQGCVVLYQRRREGRPGFDYVARRGLRPIAPTYGFRGLIKPDLA